MTIIRTSNPHQVCRQRSKGISCVKERSCCSHCSWPRSAASVAGAATKDVKLSLVAYSTPREAYNALIPEFQKTQAGNGVSFSQSYAASGDQARAVKAGLNADIVALSLAPDVDELVDGGSGRCELERAVLPGMVTNSLVVFVVRDGNPKKIRGWNDLIRPGVQVVTPNPFTSGGARWNVMAAYGAQRKLGKTDKQAQDYLLKLFKNVVSQDKSARDSLQTFNAGRGDVLLPTRTRRSSPARAARAFRT